MGPLYTTQIAVVRRPDTTHTLIQTCDWLLGTLQLLSAGFLEKVRLAQDL